MKIPLASLSKLVCTTILCYFVSITTAQERLTDYNQYYKACYKADSLYVTKNDVKSFNAYHQLFTSYKPINQPIFREVETFLKISEKLGKTDSIRNFLKNIISNSYLDPSCLSKKQRTLLKFTNKELDNLQKLYTKKRNDSLREVIVNMIKTDQEYRNNKTDSLDYIDKIHYSKIKALLHRYDLDESVIGYAKKGENTMFSIILIHVVDLDDDYSLQNQVFKKVKAGKISPYYYALMVDRRLLNQGKKQQFYTFKNNHSLSLKEVEDFNANRKDIGLYPINYLTWRTNKLYP